MIDKLVLQFKGQEVNDIVHSSESNFTAFGDNDEVLGTRQTHSRKAYYESMYFDEDVL